MSATLADLWIYPVKSMQGLRLARAQVELRGLQGDRLFAVRDAEGKFGSGKTTRRFTRMDGLLAWATDDAEGALRLRSPDGLWFALDDPACAALLSAHVGRSVTLAREAAISHFDDSPLHLITTGDLAFARAQGATPDPGSFRANLLLETPLTSAQLAPRLRLGGAEIEIAGPTERCLMVDLAPDGAPGPQTLRVLAHAANACFGCYARVVAPGALAVGDRVETA